MYKTRIKYLLLALIIITITIQAVNSTPTANKTMTHNANVDKELKTETIEKVNNYDELYNTFESNKDKKNPLTISLEGQEEYTITKQINYNEGRTRNVTILGNNKTLNGLHNTSFIKIGNGYTLNIANITITNTNSSYGSAFYNNGNLTIRDSKITNTYATTEASAIYNTRNLTVINTTFINNTCTPKAGAISNHRNLTAYNNTFINHNSTNGGVFYIYGNTNSEIVNNTIINSTAKFAGVFFTYGTGNVTINDNTITNTEALMYGAVLLNHGSPKITLTNNKITNSKAKWASVVMNLGELTLESNTIENSSATYGGAIFNWATLHLNNNKITKSSAEYGSAIYNAQDCQLDMFNNTLMDNIANDGVIYNSGSINLTNNTLIGNTVLNGYIISNKEDILEDKATSNYTMNLNDNVFINNTDNKTAMLLNPSTDYNITNNTYIGNYLESNLRYIKDNIFQLATNEVYNTTIDDGTISIIKDDTVLDTLNVTNSSIIIPEKIAYTQQTITLNYTSQTNSYQNASITTNITRKTQNTTIEINCNDDILYNNILQVNTTIKGQYDTPVNHGYVIYKINGLTLKDNGETIKSYVKNNTCILNYTLPANIGTKNYTLQATYSGYMDEYSKTTNFTQIQVKANKINITTMITPQSTMMNKNITITVKINANYTINEGYVIYKIRGLTLKDDNNKTLKVYVKNNTATLNYTIPYWNTDNAEIKVSYISKYYERCDESKTVNVTKEEIRFNSIRANLTNNLLTINGSIVDSQLKIVNGTNKVAVKVNGITLRNNDNSTRLFKVIDGSINISTVLNLTTQNRYITLDLVTQERREYKSARYNTALLI